MEEKKSAVETSKDAILTFKEEIIDLLNPLQGTNEIQDLVISEIEEKIKRLEEKINRLENDNNSSVENRISKIENILKNLGKNLKLEI